MLLSDERVDVITGDDQSQAISGEEHFVPANSPFEVLLDEVPLEESPSTLVPEIVPKLNAGINSSVTTITLQSGQGSWVTNGDTLQVDSEQMTAGTPSGNNVPVTRGVNGTTPASHSAGADVRILNSLTEILTDTPAAREFVCNYEKGWLRFNLAQANMRILAAYNGRGSLVTVQRQIHVLPDGDDFPDRPGVGMVVAKGGQVFWYNGAAWAPFASILETDTTVNTFQTRGISNLTWGTLVTKTIYVPAAGATVGCIARTVAKNNNTGSESFQVRVKIDGNTGADGSAASTPASGMRRASADHEYAVASGGRMVNVIVETYANQVQNWEHQRTEMFLWTTPWDGA